MKLSIVTTLYESSQYVESFYHRIQPVAAKLACDDYEIIFINDGSPDDSLDKAIALSDLDEKVVVVDLSRNFGHHKAIMCGLAQAQGDRIFLIDSDLEEEPEWLAGFHADLEESSCDVIYGVQRKRRGGFIERVSGKLFYASFSWLTNVRLPSNMVTARLMTKRYVDALLLHRESEMIIGGLWVITGFSQKARLVKKHAASKTTYTLSKKLSHFVNAVTSFSSAPLVLTFYIGVLMSFFSGIFIVQLLFRYYFLSKPLSGYTSLIGSIWLLAGLTILFIGIQGIYLSKIFQEVKNRPNVIIRAVYSKKARVINKY